MADRLDDATRLQRIVGDFAHGRLACEDARSAVIQVVFDRLDVDRVSLWHFEQPVARADRSLELLCFSARRRGEAIEACDDRLVLAEYRDYYNELVGRGTYASPDAMHDAALAPMRAPYLERHDIRSLVDAAFALNGRAYGMICCEAIGRRIEVRPADVQGLRAIATRLAMLLAGTDVPQLWNQPSLPMREIGP